MRTLVLAFTIVLLLAAAASLVLKDDQGRPLLFSALHLPDRDAADPLDTSLAVEAPAPAAASDARRSGPLTKLPGMLDRARQANDKVAQSADALKRQMDAADAP